MLTAAPAPAAATDAPRVLIDDAFTRDAARKAIAGAAQWLASAGCQELFGDFRDSQGRVLGERLNALGVDGAGYLGLVLFVDDPRTGTCALPGRLAYTSPGSRVVYLCGRDFERAWRADAGQAKAAVIHEILHSLGLGESPPSPRFITHRILERCYR